MIDQGLIKSHFVGRDGFIWWIGQVVDEDKWVGNFPGFPTKTTKEQKGFDFRYKVRIMGYHTAAPTDLTDEELPWASVMLPVTAGVSGGCISTPNLRQGNFVYGFFMDGEDAQMPIIMGVLGYNQYTAVMKNVPDTPFVPFSGYRTKPVKTDEGVEEADHVPTSSNPTTEEKPDESAVAEGVDVSKTNNDKIVESSAGLASRNDGASAEQFKNEKKPVYLPTDSKCEPSPVVGIQRDMQNMNNDIAELKKTLNDWETKISTTFPHSLEEEIAKVKDNAGKAITSKVKKIITEQQKKAINELNSAASEKYKDALPTELGKIKAEVEEANDALSCAFRNVMGNLNDMISGFLDQAMDRMINVPDCAANDFTGDILGKVSGMLDQALGPVKSMLKGLGVASDALSDIMDMSIDVLSFLNCDEDPDCSDVKEWNPVSGAEPPVVFNFKSILDKAKQAKSLFEKAVDQASNLDFSDTLSSLGSSSGGCNVGPRDCGPPTVEFIGGGGSGAAGNAIVSAVTTLIGVDIVFPGGGYTSAPRVVFKDSCSKGRGAVGRAVMGQVPVQVQLDDGTMGPDPTGKTTLGVTQIIIDDTGIDYLPAPDGSKGGSGRTWANPDETVVKRGGNFPGSGGIPGIYDTPHKPGEVVELYDGDEFTPPGGGTEIITEDKTVTCPPLPPTGIKPGVFPSSGTGEYPIVLEIDDINIVDGGYGYDFSKDKVVIEPANGAEMSIKCDPLGSIIGVDVIKGGIGFNEDPIIYIDSDTGYNAKLMPVFKVNRVGEDIDPQAVAPTGVIQVIDCVGKF